MSKTKNKNTNSKFKFLSYFLLLPISFFTVALMWSLKIEGSQYVCTDKLPILNFYPPFVHGTQYGDYYLIGEKELQAIWAMFVSHALIMPLYVISFLGKNRSLLIKAIIASLLVLVIFIFYSFAISTSSPPAPPTPLTIINADYKVVKLGENYAISYNYDEDIMYVGTSKVELAPFVNKSVVLTGSYAGLESPDPGLCQLTKKQCIKSQCHQIFKKDWSVCRLDIESVSIKR